MYDDYEPQEVAYQDEYVQQEEYSQYQEQPQYQEQAQYQEPQYQEQTQYQAQYQQLDPNSIRKLYNILDRLDCDNGGENMYDVLLFIFFGVFILFIIDYMYKIGVKTSSNL